MPRISHLERKSKTRLCSDPYFLHRLTPCLEFMTSVSRLYFRFFLFLSSQAFNLQVFLFFAGSGSLNQSSVSLLGSWENISTSQPIRSASAWEMKALVHGQAWFVGEYLDQPAYLSTQKIRAPIHGRGGSTRLLGPIEALLGMTHQQYPGFTMVTVGMVVGIVAFKAIGKRMLPVRSRILPSPILLKEVTWTKNPCSSDAFLVVEMLIK